MVYLTIPGALGSRKYSAWGSAEGTRLSPVSLWGLLDLAALVHLFSLGGLQVS